MKRDEYYEKLIEKVEEEMMEGNYERALKYVDKIMATKKNENLWMIKGKLLMELNKFEEALECFDKALEINEKNDMAIVLKGALLCRTNRIDEGEKLINTALKLNPKNFAALYLKGAIEGLRGRKENELKLKAEAAFILFYIGANIDAFYIFREIYYSGIDLPIRYECGIAYAAMLKFLILIGPYDEKKEEEHTEIVLDCWENKEKICKSAKILLNDMMEEEVGDIVANNEKDYTFKKLLERLEVENGEEKEN